MLQINPATLSAPVKKGQTPLSRAQFLRLIQKSLKRVLPDPMPTQLTLSQFETAQGLNQFMMGLQIEAEQNNAFNHQLFAYRKAVSRMAQYRLAEGRPEISAEQETGEFDEEGSAIMETIIVQTAIDALPATITQDTYDEEGQVTGSEDVPNPAIVADDAERAAAQALIDAMPQEVVDFDNA